jgi:hypothetical protein
MSRKDSPEINAGSMADIAFLLLIFFLVTTTMNVDTGISRKIPQKQEKPLNINVNKRNVLEININKNDELFVNGNTIALSELKQIAVDFIVVASMFIKKYVIGAKAKKKKQLPITQQKQSCRYNQTGMQTTAPTLLL